MSRAKARPQVLRTRRDRPDSSFAYPVMAVAVVIALCASLLFAFVFTSDDDGILPIQFRISQPSLSGLPVTISQIRSCSCWDGVRGQAERKYKFHVANETDHLLNVGGGERSTIRLLVAYPSPVPPSPLTVPRSTSHDITLQLGSPPDRTVQVTTRHATLQPSRVVGSNRDFALPKRYTLWAIPPNPDALAEPKGFDESYSYPTIVEHDKLLPGEEYGEERLGHGAWSFYIPLSPEFVHQLPHGNSFVLPRERYEKEVIFVGIAAFRKVGDAEVEMIGFGPAPSDAELEDPSTL